jgi:hypothetical protein
MTTTPPQKLWILLKSNDSAVVNKPVKVPTDGCQDVDDFIDAVKKKLSNELGTVDPNRITLHLTKDSPALEPDDPLPVQNTKQTALVVSVPPPASAAPTISARRHMDYKHSKAIHSSRTFLTSIAVELSKIYRISCFSSGPKNRIVTFGHITQEAYGENPEPMPAFKNKYSRLNNFFTVHEWNTLEDLNDCVNPQLHSTLPVGTDGKTKELILPIAFSHLAPDYQRLAEKTNVVVSALDLIVKNEGSVSGGSPDSDKQL